MTELVKSKVLELYELESIDFGDYVEPFSMEEEEMGAELTRERTRRSTMEEADRIALDDFVRLDLVSDVPKYQKNGLQLRIGKGLFDPVLEKAILGMAKGETQIVELPGVRAEVTVTDIRRRVLPPLTDEAVAAWGMEGIAGVQALKDSIWEKERAQYMEDMAKALAVAVSRDINANSSFQLDVGELEAVRAESREMAADMLKSAGLDPDTVDDDAVFAVSGLTKAEHFDFLQQLSEDSLKSAAIGAKQMAEDGVTVTEMDYQKALQACAEALGLSPDEAKKVLTEPKFLRQTAANYNFEKIEAAAKAWLSKN